MVQREEKTKKRRQADITPDHTVHELHILTPNSKEHSSGKLVCHLCSLQGLKAAKSSLDAPIVASGTTLLVLPLRITKTHLNIQLQALLKLYKRFETLRMATLRQKPVAG